MKAKNKIELVSLDSLIDKHLGKRGTKKREGFEQELSLELFGEAIKKVRQQRQLTQSALGELVGVQKAQISKLENNVSDVRLETLMKVFRALNTRIHFSVEMI